LNHGNSITCTDCAHNAPTFAVFCPHCGGLLPPFTSIDPNKSIAAEGQMDWQATYRPMSPIAVAGAWLVFCLALLLSVGAMAEAFRDPNSDRIERALYAMLGAASATLAVAFGYRVYRNFRGHNR
jgi:hypothetical protein